MNIQKFIEFFAEQFDEIDANDLTPETKFKDLNEWSSLIALSIIAMVDEEFEVTLNANDMINSVTIEDLYNKVISKK